MVRESANVDAKPSSSSDTADSGIIYTYTTLVEEFITDIERDGFYKIAPSMTGRFNGWDIYTKQTVQLDGCNTRASKVWRKLADSQFRGFKLKVGQWVNKAIADAGDVEPSVKNSISSIYVNLFENGLSYNKLFNVANKMPDSERFQRLLATSETEVGAKMLPIRSMLPEVLNTQDVTQLLHVLPAAEQEMLMLMLGRGLIGANGQETVSGGKIAHTWRGWCLLQSAVAGIGKSTFINTLSRVLSTLGYKVEGLPNSMTNKFGWYDPATADFTLRDDFNEDTQAQFIKNEVVKTIASGGTFTAEEKGKPHVTGVKATTLILGATNHNKQSQYIGADSGALDRANILSTYAEMDLLADELPTTLIEQWNTLASKYDVSWDALMLWLLVESAERFQALIPDMPKMAQTYKDLRAAYSVKIGLTAVEDLVKATMHLAAWHIARKVYPEDQMQACVDIAKEYSAAHLLATIGTTLVKDLKGTAFVPVGLSLANSKALATQFNDLCVEVEVNTPQKTFNKVTQMMHTNDGWRYPSQVSAYYGKMNAKELYNQVKVYEAIPSGRAKDDIQDSLAHLTSMMFKYSTVKD
jgi:hypothetical protein